MNADNRNQPPPEPEPEDIRTIDALEYSSPLACANDVADNQVKPVWVRIGQTGFKVRDETAQTFRLAVMFATHPEWQTKQEPKGN
jgi:hypothetical protein